MKKQFGFPLMLASALAFSACSSDDVAEKGSKDISALTDGGYLKMSINLPSRAANGGFRAIDQTGVTLEDGLAKEYNVKDAILILFQGKTGTGEEGKAKFHSAYKLTTSMQMDGTQQITSTTKLVQNVNKGGDANKLDADYNTLYALVVLNNNGLFEVTPTNALNIKSVANASDAMPATGTPFTGTFSDFQALKATAYKSFYTDDNAGILMMNAPLYETTGGTAEPTKLATLAKVTDNVYNTAMEAQNNPGAEIFVERAVAKVTMASTITKTGLTGAEYKKTNGLTASLDSWGLDYTNNISFLIHNAAPAWTAYNAMGDATTTNYRFGGNTPVKTGKGFRAYWGIDPNYADEAGKASNYGAGNFVRIFDAGGTGLTTAMDAANPLYCMENTFNVKNMNEDQTTRAIVKVKLTPTTGSSKITMDADGSFYIVNGNKSQIFDETKLKTFIFNNFVKKCNTVYKASLTKGEPTAADITFTALDENSEMSVKKLDVTFTDGSNVVYSHATIGAVAEVNDALKKVTKYVGGYAYYPIRIKHFGNDLTPWNAALHTQNDHYDNNNENKFLGRYGVLRNNWYDLGIKSISGIGSPVIPKAPDTPDDELESFISVRINVLSWAKRTQREDL